MSLKRCQFKPGAQKQNTKHKKLVILCDVINVNLMCVSLISGLCHSTVHGSEAVEGFRRTEFAATAQTDRRAAGPPGKSKRDDCSSVCASNEIKKSSLAGNAFITRVTHQQLCMTSCPYEQPKLLFAAFYVPGYVLGNVLPRHTHTHNHCMLFSLSAQPWSSTE